MRDHAFSIDHVESLGQHGIRLVHHIVDVVEERGHGEVHAEDAGLGDRGALVGGRRLHEHDAVRVVYGSLPLVLRVGLADVDAEELQQVSVLRVDLIRADRLIPEGRSGVGPEDQRDRGAAVVGETSRRARPLA